MQLLDEVADAVRVARGGRTHPIRLAVGLEDLFGGPLTSRQWKMLADHLACPLAEFDQGHYFPIGNFATVWDLVDHVARHRPDWELPAERTPAAWKNAQIFAGVRAVLTADFAIPAGAITRTSRLGPDLGLG
jgi:hypothetical protein